MIYEEINGGCTSLNPSQRSWMYAVAVSPRNPFVRDWCVDTFSGDWCLMDGISPFDPAEMLHVFCCNAEAKKNKLISYLAGFHGATEHIRGIKI